MKIINRSAVFSAGQGNIYTYRIPAIVNANGTLLAFCGGRIKDMGDSGNNCIMVKRSEVNGTTWSPHTVVIGDDSNSYGNCNPGG
jgi:sialidase-1